MIVSDVVEIRLAEDEVALSLLASHLLPFEVNEETRAGKQHSHEWELWKFALR